MVEQKFISIGIARSTGCFRAALRLMNRFAGNLNLSRPPAYSRPVNASGLEIASSAFPLYDRNSCSSVPPPEADPWTWSRATQAIFHEPAKPSRLELPVAA